MAIKSGQNLPNLVDSTLSEDSNDQKPEELVSNQETLERSLDSGVHRADRYPTGLSEPEYRKIETEYSRDDSRLNI